jgi:molecular chaperone DnaJ
VEPKRDYYEVLGVSRDADKKAIKDAFRKLALKYHPDRNKEPGTEERFKEIAEAYAVLLDPKKRAEYDMRGHAGVAGFTSEDLFGGINFEDLFGDLGLGFGGGLFERFFGRRAGPRRGRDLEVVVRIPLARVVTGGEETVGLSRASECSACGGTGAKGGTARHACSMCGGTGQHVRQEVKEGVSLKQISTCPSCGGRGYLTDELCPECAGTGEAVREEKLKVQIPVGAEEGMALRVPGHGMPSPEAGGAPGDLFVIVRTAPDPRFERRGANLWRTERVELPDAVLGTELRLPALDGDIDLEVPPGTQPDSILRLRSKGLPAFGGGTSGDYFIRIDVHIPEKLSAEERRLYTRLRAVLGKGG